MSEASESNGHPQPGPAWTLLAVAAAFYTGATLLGGQACWVRLIQAETGWSVGSLAWALAGVMAGLAVGSAVAGAVLARLSPRGVAIVQQFLAAVALGGSPWLIGWAGDAVFAAQRAESSIPWPGLSLAMPVLAAVLAVPFGMVLPIAVELARGLGERHLSRRGAALCAIWAGGAVLGAAMLGLALPQAVGYGWALIAMAGGHVALLITIAISLRTDDVGQSMATGRLRRRGIRGLAFWLGLLAVAGAVIWLRGLTFYFGNSVWAQAVVAAVFLAALIPGSLVGGWITPRFRRPGQLLAGVILLIAITTAASAEWLADLEQWPRWAGPLSADAPGPLIGRLASMVAAAGIVIAPPAMLMGMIFPLLLRLARGGSVEWRPGGRPGLPQRLGGRTVGRVVAWSSAGAALGALAAGGLLFELFDTRRAILAIAAGFLLMALWAEAVDPATGWGRSTGPGRPGRGGRERPGPADRHARLQRAKRYRIPWINLVLFGVAAGFCLWQSGKGSVFAEMFPQTPPNQPRRADQRAEMNAWTIPLLNETFAGVVAVQRNSADGSAELLIDRRMQGDDSPLALRVQRRLGVLPLLLSPQPPGRTRNALVIGLGIGGTTAPLVQAGVERITVAQVIPAVANTLPEFSIANADLATHVVTEFENGGAAPTQPGLAASASERVPATRPDFARSQIKLIPTDGRTVLRATRQLFDMIVVDTFYPRSPGAGNLLSVRFYKLVSRRLSDGGVFVQHLPLWQLEPADVGSIVAAFRRGFDEEPDRACVFGVMTVFGPDRPMLSLVAVRSAESQASMTLRSALRPLPERIRLLGPLLDGSADLPKLSRLGCGSGEQVLADVLSMSAMASVWPGEQPMTDAFPRTELRRGCDEAIAGRAHLRRLLDAAPVGEAHPTTTPDSPQAARFRAVRLGRRLACEAFVAGDRGLMRAKLAEAVKADPANAFANFWIRRLDYDDERRELDRLVHRAGETAGVNDSAALQAANDALAEADRLIEKFPEQAGPRLLKASMQIMIARLDRGDERVGRQMLTDAANDLADVIRRYPRAADPLFIRAEALADLGRPDEARTAMARAEELRGITSPVPPNYQRLRKRLQRAGNNV